MRKETNVQLRVQLTMNIDLHIQQRTNMQSIRLPLVPFTAGAVATNLSDQYRHLLYLALEAGITRRIQI